MQPTAHGSLQLVSCLASGFRGRLLPVSWRQLDPLPVGRQRGAMEEIESKRLVVVILHTSDLEESLRFYRDLIGLPLRPGLNEPEEDPWFGGHHAELSWREGAYLHFALFPSRASSERVTSGAEIGIQVDSVAAVHERLIAAGVRGLHEPRSEPWGETARYLDPDENIVGITGR